MSIMFKPMLADDADIDKVKYPCIVQPKVDGVRGLNVGGMFVPRSLKKFKNIELTHMFSHDLFAGFDGEITLGVDPTSLDLCRSTTAATNTIEGKYDFHWWLFDYFMTPKTPYKDRRKALVDRVRDLRDAGFGNLHIVQQYVAHNRAELEEYLGDHSHRGFEGSVIRDPNGVYKYGRSTVRDGLLLRFKPFDYDKAIVVGITEEMHNGNEAVTNALGNTERSTHQHNMVPKGRVGTLLCRKVKDGVVTDEEIKVGPGKMTADEKAKYFIQPNHIIGKVITYKHFPKGVKDKPRFPTFEGIDNPQPIVEV